MTTRPPLDPERLAPHPPWTSIAIEDELPSTNAALMGGRTGAVLIAESQLAGRGRLDRSWVTPPRAGLTFSVCLAPRQPPSAWSWLPLITGLALTDVIAASTLKWPNDLLLGGRKVAGILAQASGTSVVIGIGLNVSTRRDELPVDTATSLELEGQHRDRTELLSDILRALGARYLAWDGAAELPMDDYRDRCATIGQDVRLHELDGTVRDGRAVDVDELGRLVVVIDGAAEHITAGDIEHVRPVPG